MRVRLVREKNFSAKTHELKVTSKEMSIGILLDRAHSVQTFNRAYFVVLDNGNLYDQVRRKEIPVANVFGYVKYVRNSDGIIIAKRARKNDKLMQVIFSKK